MEELIIKNLKPLPERDMKKDLEWFCDSFGIIGERDKEKTGFKIFKIILNSTKEGDPLKINDITVKTKLSRTTVIHHLKRMEESGLVIEKKRNYELRMECLHKVVDEIENDILRSLKEIKQIAKDIDEDLEINFRE